MTYPGPDASPAGEHHSGATTIPPQPAAEAPAEKSGVKKVLGIAGPVVVAGVVGVGSLTGWFGIGDPKVGDCGQSKGATSFEVVDCDAEGAEFTIVGIEDEELTWPDFEAAASTDDICQAFPTWEVALWTGELETEPGTVYCAVPL